MLKINQWITVRYMKQPELISLQSTTYVLRVIMLKINQWITVRYIINKIQVNKINKGHYKE